MKIAFISTRGIPNNYGGFEQFAEYISVGLASRGHEVVVYSPKFHPYKEDNYKGVRIKHVYSPEEWMGSSVGGFFYDFLSLRDSLKREKFDIIYEAGYTSIVPAYIWFDVKNIKTPVFTTNMDGLEYKRTKFNKWVQKFLFWEERTTVKHSYYLIADNMGIRDYYKEKYGKESKFLAYGANIHEDYDESLLEAMASSCYILAHDNIFNRAVLKENAHYYDDAKSVTQLLDNIYALSGKYREQYVNANLEEIRSEYSWGKLVDEHEKYFEWLLEQKR